MGFPHFYFDRGTQKYYHAALMSARAVIDGLEFARTGSEMRGEVPVAMLGRLADELYDDSGILQYTLAGQLDGRQRPRLRLQVTGTLNLRCQRCLGSLEFSVDQVSNLLLLERKSGGAEAELDDLDAIAADPEMDVWSLVEDEVLLAQPMAPRHAEGACAVMLGGGKDAAASPFAVLAGLKKKQVN
jgi:uncharacterized protein